MKTYLLRAVFFAACLATRLAAAEEAQPPPPASTPASLTDAEKKQEEAIRARLAEHALKKAHPSADATTTAPSTAEAATPVTPEKENPTMLLPRVEVNQTRITELAVALHEKDLEIAREKKNIKPSALDESINDTEVAHKLAIFGGSAAEDRSRLAEDRVMVLEAERDLIEQIFNARTDEERAMLQKQMDDLKTMRRQLERTPKDTRGE